jgi:chemotaxis protein MotA
MAEGRAILPVARARSGLDLATIVGLISGFGLISTAIFLGGQPGSFVNIPGVLIVFGGTFAVTTICFSVGEVLRTFRVVTKAILYSGRDPMEVAVDVLRVAEMARRQGVLALQGVTDSLSTSPFFLKGLLMVVDGTPGEEVEMILRRDMQATLYRHTRAASVLRKAAEFAPAMGLIGTLIGLVQMLGSLDDPSTIGPSMAVALLTTFYGAVLANMVFSPLASKLERNSAEEALVNNLFTMGVASIGRQENPRRLEMLLNSVLPPNKRVQYFD